MGKLKTHKAIAKRFVIKKGRRGITILKRTDGQDHFNARESGKTGRNKKRDRSMANTHTNRTILRAMRYT